MGNERKVNGGLNKKEEGKREAGCQTEERYIYIMRHDRSELHLSSLDCVVISFGFASQEDRMEVSSGLTQL